MRLAYFIGPGLVAAVASCARSPAAAPADPVAPAKTAQGGPAMEKATFGAGCFWHVEETFRQVTGVVTATVGYEGGSVPDPTYKLVCTDKTGHAEVVQVEYDPAKVSYDKLLDVFWSLHDPTTLNRQGPDVGTQYRSVILYHSAEQKAAATASKERLQQSGKYRRPIITQIVPAAEFYKAEDYHQQYLQKRGLSKCPTQ